ncbi:MAG TPA: DUF4350 domain-containing protein [Myxococcaceae bacterium]|nr:DUF4350 domain-containing protein [Myxococcaceae bacterium]
MRGARLWIVYGALLGVGAALGLASQSAPAVSRVPSIDNPGPAGLEALYLLLRERGFDARRIDARFSAVPAELHTLVLAEPVEREIDRDEVAILRAYVEQGGRLVYLAPPQLQREQPEMARWLQLYPSGGLKLEESGGEDSDLGGSYATVWAPPAPDVRRLRVGAGRGIASNDPESVPAAGQRGGAATLSWRTGRGEIWVFMGAEVAENRRLELGDNLALWEAFAADGPIGFDEGHHVRAASPGLPPALLTVAAQLAFATLAFALARGARLGPPRPEPVERHRSVMEYVTSMAWLTRRARVEPALVGALITRLRHAMSETAGVPITASDAEAALQVELRARIPRDRVLATLETLRAAAAGPRLPASGYLRCARIAAELERALSGRDSLPHA